MTISINKLMQSSNVVPVCRVHVYQNNSFDSKARSWTDAALPSHWAGRNKPGTDRPAFILGKEGVYINMPKVLKKANLQPMEWELLDARVNLTRQWSCSSAMFQIARPIDPSTMPEAPPVRPNDVVVIEMGYVRGLDSKVSLKNGQTDYTSFVGDVVFYGIVDTVKERGGSGERDGIVVTITARDAMSIMSDNKIRGHYKPSQLNEYNRAFIIRDMIWRGGAIDYIKWAKDPKTRANKLDNFGFRIPLKEAGSEDRFLPEDFNAENCYLKIGILERSSRKEVAIPEEGNQEGIPIMDKYPLDVIRHLSLVEPAPREFWADPRTGHINWMYRRTDARNLRNNPELRQYFYMYPADRANILSYTNEWSTAGTITHFTVSNPLASSTNEKGTMEIYAESPSAFLTDPHTKIPLRQMTRNRFVYDDTLIVAGEAEAVANALFTIWGRSVQTGMVMVLGDPSLNIGEAVQIFNTGLFGRRYHESDPKTLDNTYDPEGTNPEGIYRVEALTHLFAIGGAQAGYKTVFAFGPVDTNTGAKEAKRLIETDQDYAAIEKITITDFYNNGNNK